MKQAIKNFNELLKSNNSVGIVCIEYRTECTIEAKNDTDGFIKALQAVVNYVYDYAECEITGAELFDSGYSMEVKATLFIEDKPTNIEFYLYHANAF